MEEATMERALGSRLVLRFYYVSASKQETRAGGVAGGRGDELREARDEAIFLIFFLI